jgi:hypothetical protein
MQEVVELARDKNLASKDKEEQNILPYYANALY